MTRGQRLRRSTKWTRVSRMVRAGHPWCAECGAGNDLTVDHIVPLAKGGAAYDPQNLQVLCRRCNSSKQDRSDRGVSLGSKAPRRPLPVFSLPPGTPVFPTPQHLTTNSRELTT